MKLKLSFKPHYLFPDHLSHSWSPDLSVVRADTEFGRLLQGGMKYEAWGDGGIVRADSLKDLNRKLNA